MLVVHICNNHGRNFVVKYEGTAWCESINSRRVDAEVKLHKYRFSVLFFGELNSFTCEMSCLSCLTLQKKTINRFSAKFQTLKKLKTFLMLLGIMHAAPPVP